MEISKEQLKIIEGLTNLRMKWRVMNWMLVAFFLILGYFMVFARGWEEKTIVGVLEGVLAHTFYPVINHYFPALKEAAKSTRKNRVIRPANDEEKSIEKS